MKVKKLTNSSDWGMPSRTGIGVSVSVLYTALLISLVVWRWADVLKLELNELGDFAAGAFGPMAILWLVLGYFQQGDELKQNTAALALQAEELANSVTQQAALVALTREQLDEERRNLAEQKRALHRQSQPRFHFSCDLITSGMGARTYRITAVNVGATCTHVHFHGKGNAKVEVMSARTAQLERNQAIDAHIKMLNTRVLDGTALRISYIDALGAQGGQNVDLVVLKDERSGWSISARGPQDITMGAIEGQWG